MASRAALMQRDMKAGRWAANWKVCLQEGGRGGSRGKGVWVAGGGGGGMGQLIRVTTTRNPPPTRPPARPPIHGDERHLQQPLPALAQQLPALLLRPAGRRRSSRVLLLSPRRRCRRRGQRAGQQLRRDGCRRLVQLAEQRGQCILHAIKVSQSVHQLPHSRQRCGRRRAPPLPVGPPRQQHRGVLLPLLPQRRQQRLELLLQLLALALDAAGQVLKLCRPGSQGRGRSDRVCGRVGRLQAEH